MTVFSWNDILGILDGSNPADFLSGHKTGISVGSFDGLHLGHRAILEELVKNCKKNALAAGAVSFSRPLPSIKHSEDYQGDLTTLPQRLRLFEAAGLDFVIIVDFDDSFASMLGTDFLNILLNVCNMELLVEGIDFRCGYKGATDAQAIRYWGNQNNVSCVFVNQVFYREGTDEEERVSSSYIRGMVQKGFFTTVTELLARPYELDMKNVRNHADGKQALPPDGIYRVKTETDEEVRLEIRNRTIQNVPECDAVKFTVD